MDNLPETTEPAKEPISRPELSSAAPEKNDKGYLMVLYIMTFIGIFIMIFGVYLLMQPEKQRKVVGMVVLGIGIFDIIGGYLFSKYLRPTKQ